MRKKSVLSAAGGLVVVLAAAWFGIDLGNNSTTDNSGASAARVSTQTSTRVSTRVSTPPKTTASASSDSSNIPSCPLHSLPTQADEVVDDILAGGPFDYPADDGIHFGNYQRVLPREKSSYYREYTVETPGVRHRGARRIVVGGGTETDPDVWYYTDDHYDSFCKIPDAEE